MKRLIGVGVGPGDPELVTVKAIRVLREADAVLVPVLARAGEVVRGHEFHRTAAVPVAGDQPAWQLGPGAFEGHVAGSVVASYLHTHWAGHPAATARFTAACAKAPPP